MRLPTPIPVSRKPYAVCQPSPEPLNVGRTKLGVRAIADPEAELADRALEGVRQQDGLVPEELPAGIELGEEAGSTAVLASDADRGPAAWTTIVAIRAAEAR